MGQVWSKANFDGTNAFAHLGGRGSVLAVTAQNPGPDAVWETGDDLLTRMNEIPVWVSVDWTSNSGCGDLHDRVRGFNSLHSGRGANFIFADGSVRFQSETISLKTYQGLSTINGQESVP